MMTKEERTLSEFREHMMNSFEKMGKACYLEETDFGKNVSTELRGVL